MVLIQLLLSGLVAQENKKIKKTICKEIYEGEVIKLKFARPKN